MNRAADSDSSKNKSQGKALLQGVSNQNTSVRAELGHGGSPFGQSSMSKMDKRNVDNVRQKQIEHSRQGGQGKDKTE